MALNTVYETGDQLSVACSHPATPVSGDPVRFGEATGIAYTNEDADGNTTVNFGPFMALFSVKAVNTGGNNAIAVGDKLYYVDADNPVLSKKDTGRFFGYAWDAVAAGATATIRVKHAPC